MCVNDIACAGGEPLFFLDYIACGKNDPEKIATIVSGVANGCKQAVLSFSYKISNNFGISFYQQHTLLYKKEPNRYNLFSPFFYFRLLYHNFVHIKSEVETMFLCFNIITYYKVVLFVHMLLYLPI